MSHSSSRQYASQLLFEVSVSKIYQRITLFIAVLCLLAIISIDRYFPILPIVLMVFMAFAIRNAIKNNTPRKFQWQPQGGWLITENSLSQNAKLCAGSVVSPFFSSLIFKLDNNKKFVQILFNDNIDKDKFRQLRVRIKLEGIKSHDTISQ